MVPEKELCGLTFFPIPNFTPIDSTMGAKIECYFDRYNLPKVPRKYITMVEMLFFNGGYLPNFHPKVDISKATLAIKSWLCSFSPAHEAKIATVGYAIWLWTHPEALNEE